MEGVKLRQKLLDFVRPVRLEPHDGLTVCFLIALDKFVVGERLAFRWKAVAQMNVRKFVQ